MPSMWKFALHSSGLNGGVSATIGVSAGVSASVNSSTSANLRSTVGFLFMQPQNWTMRMELENANSESFHGIFVVTDYIRGVPDRMVMSDMVRLKILEGNLNDPVGSGALSSGVVPIEVTGYIDTIPVGTIERAVRVWGTCRPIDTTHQLVEVPSGRTSDQAIINGILRQSRIFGSLDMIN